MTRVLHLGAGNLYGGIERQLVALARYRSACPSVQPEFGLCFEGQLSSELRAEGVDVSVLGGVRLSRPWTAASATRNLRQLLATRRPDIVVCHSFWPHAVFASTVREAGIPLVFYAHDVPSGKGWLERRTRRTPPDLVIANSRYTARAVPRLFPNLRVETHYCTVPATAAQNEADRERYRAELRVAKDTAVIIITSRMEPWKGHRLLLAALARLKRERANTAWECWIVGGPQRPSEEKYFAELEELARETRLVDRVKFLGQRDDVPRLLRAADIHCQPNTSPEPFGIAFVEALGAGLPVVTVNLGAAAEIVTESCGLLVPPADSRALADSLHALIDAPQRRHELGAAGRARAASLCDPNHVIPELYASLSTIADPANDESFPRIVEKPLHGVPSSRPARTQQLDSTESQSPSLAAQRGNDSETPAPPAPIKSAQLSPRALPRSMSSAAVVVAFVILQFACQVALLVPSLGPLRVLIRAASLGGSLALLLVLKDKPRYHPAWTAALCVLGLMAVEIFHPTGNALLARLAQVGLYAAILAPIFWIGRARLSAKDFRTIIVVFWAFHSLSSLAGAAQVYFPQLQPPVSMVIQGRGADYVDSLKIKLPDGRVVFRPMGLTDQPGGAAMAGMYAVLFGLGIFLVERRWPMRATCLGTMAIGLFVLYLSQVRSVLVMTGICVLAFCVMMALRRDYKRLTTTLCLLAGVIAMSFLWALQTGGEVVTGRLLSLVNQPVSDVYYTNRGHFLSDTVYIYLPKYPLGAGLGRWGMMNQYFGDNSDPESGMIWVEIQWTAWLLDGGVPLILAYVTALLIAMWVAWRIARQHSGTGEDDGGIWGSLIVAYNLAALAVTFNYPLFIGQGGLEFWLVNCCLFAAYGAVPEAVARFGRAQLPNASRRIAAPQGITA